MVLSATDILLQYVCPSLGCIMASLMFAAPIQDLRKALLKGSLGVLNPLPWAVMTGNCLGWIAYGYYVNDAFVYAANVPGLVLSIWLNLGASKLQYAALADTLKQQSQQQTATEDWNASPIMEADDDEMDDVLPDGADNTLNNTPESLIFVPQEIALFRVLIVWAVVLTWVGWFSTQDPSIVVGIVVNINLVFFYGAPLHTIQTVVAERNCESIHVPTMVMNWTNTTFWILYGLARQDFVIAIPNSLGLSLGLVQGLLCLLYPSTPRLQVLEPLNPDEANVQDEDANTDDSPTNGASVATVNMII